MSRRAWPTHPTAPARCIIVGVSCWVSLTQCSQPVFSAVAAVQDLLCLVQELLAGDLWHAISDPGQAAGLRWQHR